jgi:hypothetical protein
MTQISVMGCGWLGCFGKNLTPEWVFHSLHHFSGEANTTKKIRNSAFCTESDKLLGDIEAFLQESTTLIIDIPLSEDLLEKYNY